MHIDEVWNKFGTLTKHKNKEEFVKNFSANKEKMAALLESMTEQQKKEVQKSVKDFIASLDTGYSLEERLRRQWKVLNMLKQTDKPLEQFLYDEMNSLPKK